MKYRSGFVSNSSSSSFVMLFPDDFAVEKIDWSKFDFEEFIENSYYGDDDADEADQEKIKEQVKEGLKKLLSGETLWDEEDAAVMTAIETLFPDYIIGEISTDGDSGQMALADKTKAKKILGVV